MFKDKKIGLISLGCDKNRVDSERALALCREKASVTSSLEDANIIIVNTCAFLESARKEAIDTILECNEFRSKNLEKIVVTGCLPEKFIDELYDELVEVDVFLGINDYDLLFNALELAYKGERVKFVKKNSEIKIKNRILTTPCHYFYLKIADGCNNKCTYCLIPKIRGEYRSTKIEDLIEEVKSLGESKEIILVAQDITRYGVDLYGEPKLVTLIKELSKLDEVNSIRLLYAYPDMISDELIEEIKNNKKVINYLDIPLQHASDGILKKMNRKGTFNEYLSLIDKLKSKVEGIAIRSTFITGFPGESKKDFKTLCDFIKKAEFTNCGFFAYSREDGTPAYKLPDQIDEKTKQKRVKKLYAIQRKISKNYLKKYRGQTIDVVCDGVDYDNQSFYGRAYFNAPEIDGKVYFDYGGVIEQGKTYKVKILKTNDYDLFGSVEDEFTE